MATTAEFDRWRDEANCLSTDRESFFNDGLGSHAQNRAAKRVCNNCVVRKPCLEAALREEDDLPYTLRFGVRGGMTPLERYGLARHRQGQQFVKNGRAYTFEAEEATA